MEVLLNLGLGNYYGDVQLVMSEGKYYLALENYNKDTFIEITEFLAMQILKEFKKEKEPRYGYLFDGTWSDKE